MSQKLKIWVWNFVSLSIHFTPIYHWIYVYVMLRSVGSRCKSKYKDCYGFHHSFYALSSLTTTNMTNHQYFCCIKEAEELVVVKNKFALFTNHTKRRQFITIKNQVRGCIYLVICFCFVWKVLHKPTKLFLTLPSIKEKIHTILEFWDKVIALM